jgi:hypothetical protein
VVCTCDLQYRRTGGRSCSFRTYFKRPVLSNNVILCGYICTWARYYIRPGIQHLEFSISIVNALGIRFKPYLTQIVSTIFWRLNDKSAKVRQQAADLTTRLAVVIKQFGKDQFLSKLGLVLFEQLGDEYPDTLGSIIAVVGAIANVVGMTQMNPPVKDLREFSYVIIPICFY